MAKRTPEQIVVDLKKICDCANGPEQPSFLKDISNLLGLSMSEIKTSLSSDPDSKEKVLAQLERNRVAKKTEGKNAQAIEQAPEHEPEQNFDDVLELLTEDEEDEPECDVEDVESKFKKDEERINKIVGENAVELAKQAALSTMMSMVKELGANLATQIAQSEGRYRASKAEIAYIEAKLMVAFEEQGVYDVLFQYFCSSLTACITTDGRVEVALCTSHTKAEVSNILTNGLGCNEKIDHAAQMAALRNESDAPLLGSKATPEPQPMHSNSRVASGAYTQRGQQNGNAGSTSQPMHSNPRVASGAYAQRGQQNGNAGSTPQPMHSNPRVASGAPTLKKVTTLLDAKIQEGKLILSVYTDHRKSLCLVSDGKDYWGGTYQLKVGDLVYMATDKRQYISFAVYKMTSLSDKDNSELIFDKRIYAEEEIDKLSDQQQRLFLHRFYSKIHQ